ncbi:unnamed protein product [Spirodela intermedia]|uniref:Uncharacterized protein n=1 Tax=Spirodela intermedia TaxID=51605 RepID=A0A7I8IVV0_SPIIN|nr:unnamed protein product [Spirodela intermedia]CAA6661762.1 unnamed protein product [Spirodela intermedia]
MSIFSLITGRRGPSGFGSASTAEDVTQDVDASHLTVIVTGDSEGPCPPRAHVVIAARNTEAAQATKSRILGTRPSARVEVLKLDLCSMRSIRAFAEAFLAMGLPLNILINNAGVMFCPFQLSEDGFETQFATNHLGHFLLTNLLLEKMKATAKETGIEGGSYSDKKAYGQSKLANILHASELSRRLQEEGANITVNSVHPGLIMTNLMRHSVVLMRAIQAVTYLMWKNVPQGAATTCYVALHPALKGVTGKYFLDCNETKPSALAETKHWPGSCGSSARSWSNLLHEWRRRRPGAPK